MTITITVDCREQKLLDEMKRLQSTETTFKDITIVTESLLLGDIHIKTETHQVLIERKTVDDLLASIRDGRYDEQSYRLQTQQNVYYFIEGKVRRSQQTVYSSILSLGYFKGFSVIKTDDLKETANMILYFAVKLNRENAKQPFTNKVHQTKSEGEEDVYASLIQKKKNDNITVSNFPEIVLCQIPLVNHTYASVIMKQYDYNLMKLITALQTDPHCLDTLTYTTSMNKVRKISKPCLQNIVKFLLPG
jgi:ERCC4-type nuclease